MKEVLLRKLIEKEYFGSGTEIEAVYKGVDLSGRPIHSFQQSFIVSALFESRKDRSIILEAKSKETGFKMRMGVDDIINIDGMTPKRFAENYMLDLDGNDIKASGKRRGRRPKSYDEFDDEEDYEEELM